MDWGTLYETGRTAVGAIFNVGKDYVKDAFKDEVVDKALSKASDKLLGTGESESGSRQGSSVSLGGRFSLSVSDPAAPTVTSGASVNSASAYSARWSRIMSNARATARGTTVRSPITITSRINRPRQKRIT